MQIKSSKLHQIVRSFEVYVRFIELYYINDGAKI